MSGVGRGLGEGGEGQEWRVPPPNLSSPDDLLGPGVSQMHPNQQWVLGGPSSFTVQVQHDPPSFFSASHSPQLHHPFLNDVNHFGCHRNEDLNYSYFLDSPPAGLLQPGVAHIHTHQQQLDWPMFPPLSQQIQQDRLLSAVNTSRFKWRMQWTPELHYHFVNAVNQIGGPEKAKPKAISNIMRVEGLSLSHIKSHLQKYRYDVLAREAAARKAAEQVGSDNQGPEANPAVSPEKENDVVYEEFIGDINPTASLNQNEPLHVSSEHEQHNLWPINHSRVALTAHTGSSSQPQELWESEEDPIDTYLNFQDDAGDATNI